MGYLPAILLGVAGLLGVVALVAVLPGHLRRTERAAHVLRAAVEERMTSLRAGVAAGRDRRAVRR
jgi:hypothetical protein